jgi:hypothetical protein
VGSDAVVGWVITVDNVFTDTAQKEGKGRRGYGMTVKDLRETIASFQNLFGRRVTVTENLMPGAVEDPVKFKLFDDDGNLYYEGVIRRDWLNGDEEYAFSPHLFGHTDAGSSELHYEEDGKWKVL